MTDISSTLHIVEDDTPVREALVLVLEGEGYRVKAWESGERFLSEADLGPEDLLLLDLGLPGLSGAEVAARLSREGKRVRTVVLSGLRGRAFDSAVQKIAPVAALRKPVHPSNLSQTLRGLCA